MSENGCRSGGLSVVGQNSDLELKSLNLWAEEKRINSCQQWTARALERFEKLLLASVICICDVAIFSQILLL